MSSTNRGGQRLADDYYATPSFATRAIIPHLNWIKAKTVLDPCAGDGAILREARSCHPEVEARGIELDPVRANKAGCHCYCMDALTTDWGSPDITIFNPPFLLSQEFIDKALRERPRGGEVAVLMRLGMLAGQERATFWRFSPADIYVLAKRPNFTEYLRYSKEAGEKPCGFAVPNTKNGTCKRPFGHEGDCLTCGGDSADYCWAVWGPGMVGRWSRLDQ